MPINDGSNSKGRVRVEPTTPKTRGKFGLPTPSAFRSVNRDQELALAHVDASVVYGAKSSKPISCQCSCAPQEYDDRDHHPENNTANKRIVMWAIIWEWKLTNIDLLL